MEETKQTLANEVFDWLEILATSIIAVVLIFTFVFRVATIKGESMMDTLHEGEKVIITDWGYTPSYGDIVVISRNVDNTPADRSAKTPIIKRVIATAGQTVDIDFERGVVYVDGKALDEPYTYTTTNKSGDVSFPLYVPDGYVFCLGDNRNNSLDSRFTQIGKGGLIDERYIIGHARFRILPFNKIGSLDFKD